MRIAVTYDNGTIFMHFGKTEQFKVYDVEDGQIMMTEILNTNGNGHHALAEMLAANDIDVLICGGIGESAQQALVQSGIKVVSGAAGGADLAVRAYMAGDLETTGANCHHHEQGHHCGGHHYEEQGGEGGNDCGSCDDCRSSASSIQGRNVGKQVSVHYRGTLDDGSVFDSSYERNEPLEFICGAGQMIKGFDAAVAVMTVGEEMDIRLTPEMAYGPSDPNMIFTVKISEMPGAEELFVGQGVYLSDQIGRQFPVRVSAKDDTTVTFDANHEMAGKVLNFHIELLEVIE